MHEINIPTRAAWVLIAALTSVSARAETPAPLPTAAYDVALVDRALEHQAWVVLQAAAAHAEQNGGRYPERVAEFSHRLPRQAPMANVWTGEPNVPSDEVSSTAGAIEYRAVYWRGHPVGCQIVAIGRFGARKVLVSDLT